MELMGYSLLDEEFFQVEYCSGSKRICQSRLWGRFDMLDVKTLSEGKSSQYRASFKESRPARQGDAVWLDIGKDRVYYVFQSADVITEPKRSLFRRKARRSFVRLVYEIRLGRTTISSVILEDLGPTRDIISCEFSEGKKVIGRIVPARNAFPAPDIYREPYMKAEFVDSIPLVYVYAMLLLPENDFVAMRDGSFCTVYKTITEQERFPDRQRPIHPTRPTDPF